MRVGLVFLAGLLVGGLVVAWLVSEPPGEPQPAVAVEQAPAAPMAPAEATPVLPTPMEAARAPPSDASETPGPPPLTFASTPPPPVTGTPLLPPLRVPVEGVTVSDLVDSFSDARGEDRVHDALDIMAAEGTPVFAAADGPVVKLFDSVPGGLTLYQFDEAGRVAFYYAHLQRYAEGVEEGKQLRQGDVLGYVGHTGNADPAAPHLHFAVFVLGPEKNWWEGEAINPYPLLKGAAR